MELAACRNKHNPARPARPALQIAGPSPSRVVRYSPHVLIQHKPTLLQALHPTGAPLPAGLRARRHAEQARALRQELRRVSAHAMMEPAIPETSIRRLSHVAIVCLNKKILPNHQIFSAVAGYWDSWGSYGQCDSPCNGHATRTSTCLGGCSGVCNPGDVQYDTTPCSTGRIQNFMSLHNRN